jgi:glutamine synthetase
MSLILESLGIPVEVFTMKSLDQARTNCTKFSTLVQRADRTQVLKYVVQNVANAYGKPRRSCPSRSLATTHQYVRSRVDLERQEPVCG